MTELSGRIQAIAQPFLDAHDAFLVDVLVRNEQRTKVLQVMIDTDKGITINECAEISRELGKELEARGTFEEPYHLEVSSPGLDRPLRMLRQYQKNIGRVFKVRYSRENTQSEFVGTLSGVEGNQISFSAQDGKTVTVEFDTIIESKEELPW